MNDTTNDNSQDEWAAAMAEQTAAEQTATEQPGDDEWGAAMAEQAASEEAASPKMTAKKKPQGPVEKASFEDFRDEGGQGQEEINLEVVLDIPVTISMEIGRTRIPIRNLLQLNQGSVVELDRLAGEPLDVLVNDTLIAHGEVVVVNEKFGIRLTDVISPAERVKKLK